MTAGGAQKPNSLRRAIPRYPSLFTFLLSLASGIFGALGQAPYHQPLALVVALAIAFYLWRAQPHRRAASIVGWAFGTGYFALTLFWIVEPFQVDVARHGWMAPFALMLLSAGLALFWGTAFWAARLLSSSAFALTLTWTAAELMRAYIFTGFPWASPAQIAVDGPISRLLAWTGPHGTTLFLMILAWALSMPAGKGTWWPLRAGQAAICAGSALAFYLPLARPPAEMTDHWVRLIQPNAEQHLKWHPDHAELYFQRQLSLTAAPPADPAHMPDLIVWPETAIPWRLETAQPVLTEIAHVAGEAKVALGLLRYEGSTLRNSLVVLDPQGKTRAIYDKHHLVPFGEFIPFSDLAARFGLRALVEQRTGFSSGPGPVVLDFDGMGNALPLICYEAVFAHDVNAAPVRPDFLLQITNDAWFGSYAGPQQHLAQARMRAVEQGLPLMRAANTGISAMIDPFGRTIATLPLDTAGFLDAPLPKPLPPSFYSKIGDLPVLILLVLGLVYTGVRCKNRAVAERD